MVEKQAINVLRTLKNVLTALNCHPKEVAVLLK